MSTNEATSQSQPSTPELVTVDETVTAVVRAVVPAGELMSFFDRSFGALDKTIAAQQVAVKGPAFARYYREPAETVDLEVGFATDRSIQPDGDVAASTLPAARVARLVHAGSFEELGSSWAQLRSWMDAQGLTPGTTLWEVYLTEPSPEMDPADLRTELNWSVSD